MVQFNHRGTPIAPAGDRVLLLMQRICSRWWKNPRKSVAFGKAPASEAANGAGNRFYVFHAYGGQVSEIHHLLPEKTAADNSGGTAENSGDNNDMTPLFGKRRRGAGRRRRGERL